MDKAQEEIHGIDVSHWQGEIQWSKVKSAGIAFAFLKATEGSTSVDERFAGNAAACKKQGILAGAYHFARPKLSGGLKQAKHFIATVQRVSQLSGLLPILDLEDAGGLSSAELVAWTQEWTKEVQRVWPHRVVFYLSPAFAQAHLNSGLPPSLLWLAQWHCDRPQEVPPWSRWTFWQYSDSGQVAGVSGKVDLDLFAGSQADLERVWKREVDKKPYSLSPTLRQGSRGAVVEMLQVLLYKVGQHPGALTGWFGPETLSAVKAAQHRGGISSDGIVGPETWSMLVNQSTPLRRVLARGTEGIEVKDLQNLLNYRNAVGILKVDGIFSSATETAVRAFQRRVRVTVDGVAGIKTWNHLLSVSEGGAQQGLRNKNLTE